MTSKNKTINENCFRELSTENHPVTCVVHPGNDETTSFLSAIYAGMNPVTLLQERHELLDAELVRRCMDRADRIVCLGHGLPSGLLARGSMATMNTRGNRFGAIINTVVSDEEVPCMRGKHLVAIWCYAAEFARHHNLDGFFTGMFCSEPIEAHMCRIECTDEDIELSNEVFANAVGEALKYNMDIYRTAQHVALKYGELLPHNPVARYNFERLCARVDGMEIMPSIVAQAKDPARAASIPGTSSGDGDRTAVAPPAAKWGGGAIESCT